MPMPTNILQLPAFSGDGTSFAIATNADWLDSIFFISPQSPSAPITMVGQLTMASNVVVVESTLGLVPGMPISPMPALDPLVAYFVGEISTTTQFKMVDQLGYAQNAKITDASAQLVFQPLPLDLSGIEFRAELRVSADSEQVLLSLQTSDSTLLNGGSDGTLGFNVASDKLQHLKERNYVMDIVAYADGHVVNLFPAGPCTVSVTEGVTVT